MNTFDGWNDELYHHGIKGQKWGLRQYQNEDGTLTEAGKARYGVGGSATAKERASFLNKLDQQKSHNLAVVNQTKRVTKRQDYMKGVNRTERTINEVLRAAERDNIRLTSKDVTRHTITGKNIVKSIVASAAATGLSVAMGGYTAYQRALRSPIGVGTATAPIIPIINTTRVRGKKYKVGSYS